MERAARYWWAMLLALAVCSQTVVSMAGSQVQDQTPPHHRPLLTEDQKTCVEQLLGSPDDGTPSRELRNKAFRQCGVVRAPSSAMAERVGDEEEI